jgi:hypothetical protein
MPGVTRKARLKVRNWREYNASLVARGSIMFWFSDDVLAAWYHPNASCKRGRPFKFSDSTIEVFLTIRELFRLPYRQTEGCVRGLLALVSDGLDVPDFTSAAKRAAKLGIKLPVLPKSGHIDVVLDSTGLKVFGEGEWKVRQHGKAKHRLWQKLHVAVDPTTHEILAEVLTTNAGHDADQVQTLLSEVPAKIRRVTGDGAYDMWKSYNAIKARGARSCIAPRRNARIKRHGNLAGTKLERDEAIRAIRRIGRAAGKRRVRYHRRSLVETAMFRLKMTFGSHLKNRLHKNQSTEARLRCKILNQFTQAAMKYD